MSGQKWKIGIQLDAVAGIWGHLIVGELLHCLANLCVMQTSHSGSLAHFCTEVCCRILHGVQCGVYSYTFAVQPLHIGKQYVGTLIFSVF